MKLFKLSLLAASVIILFSSCRKVVGEGPVITQERSTAPYSGIEVSIPASVEFTEAPNYKLQLEAQQNILNIIETYVSNGKLILKFDRNNINTNATIRVQISAPHLNNINQIGSGSFQVISPFTPDDLKINLSGSGIINISEIETGSIDATVSGSGKIQGFSGTINNGNFNISGSGTIDFIGVRAQNVNTQSSGSGTMRVFAEKELDVHISGSGNVYYKGNPTINTSISGSGKVVKL
jgi:hypothetical protein